ncbi:MAG: hypothetical protein IKS29_01020 [Oscillospiraceae bacterium]|nr:hypothetical protein [Oscillospiraceae bacterium]
MFEKFMLDPSDPIENVVRNGVIEGIKIKVRIPYYRGVMLALVQDAEVTVGDKVFSRDQMTFWVRGQEYHFEDMKTITSVRWEFGEKAELFVPLINGLPEYGPTSIRVGIQILVSYSPFNRMSYAHMNYDRSASGGVCR